MIATSIEQSKKLVEIGIDPNTADMFYGYIAPYEFSDRKFDGGYESYPLPKQYPYFDNEYVKSAEIPAWSLSALFNVMSDELEENHYLTIRKEENEYCCCYEDVNGNSFTHTFSDNPIDACVEMIVKLHKEELL